MTTSHVRTTWPSSEPFVVTDGGLETWLLFQQGVDLPAFAAYPLTATEEGMRLLTEYYQHYAAIAHAVRASIVLETPTWRANPEWAATLGHDLAALSGFIAASIDLLDGVRNTWPGPGSFLIGGAVGPRGDGYRIDTMMTAEAAMAYHSFQIECMAEHGVDVITGMTIGYVEEAIGIVRAAQAAGVPVVISFTLETDGRLPSGMSLREAIEVTDAATNAGAQHFMINCAHPTHFADLFDGPTAWVSRIVGLRANASRLSHAELDEMVELDEGDPADLAARYVALRSVLPALQVLGGCCGTDHRHVGAIAQAWRAALPPGAS